MKRLTSTLILRNLTAAEAECLALLPPELREIGWPKPDPNWIWIVDHRDHGPIALVMGSHVSGVCVFFRLLTTAQAKGSSNWMLAALPAIFEDIRQRGCVGYASWFRDSRPEEVRFARLMAQAGGIMEAFQGTFGVVPLLPDGVDSSCLHSVLQRLSNS